MSRWFELLGRATNAMLTRLKILAPLNMLVLIMSSAVINFALFEGEHGKLCNEFFSLFNYGDTLSDKRQSRR